MQTLPIQSHVTPQMLKTIDSNAKNPYIVIPLVKKGLNFLPENSDKGKIPLYLRLIKAYRKCAKHKETIDIAEKAIIILSKRKGEANRISQLYLRIAHAYHKLGDANEAKIAANAGLKLLPDNSSENTRQSLEKFATSNKRGRGEEKEAKVVKIPKQSSSAEIRWQSGVKS